MATVIVRDGVFAINKPCGISSAQVIRECQQAFNSSACFKPMIEAEISRRLTETGQLFNRRKAVKRASQVKIGHGGTLDPLATGVLILGIGTATKQLTQFLNCTKTYEATVIFGVSTDTYDRAGRVLARRGYDHVTKELVEKELAGFRGKQTQIPPLYSALKMDGKPLYEYAREGKPIPREIEGRAVEALEIELVEWYEPGKHSHRWPTEEAEAVERNLAEQVWRVKKQQETSKPLTPEEKELDDQAVAAHETFKKLFEERQDELIKDKPIKERQHLNKDKKVKKVKKVKNDKNDNRAMMSGGLGAMPQPAHSKQGSNLVPAKSDPNTPPPWGDDGPPACKIRLTVSSGYYVRSFCHDFGTRVGSAAIMAELCRVRQSDFTVGGPNTLEYDDLARKEQVWGPKIANMLARWNGEPESSWPGTQSPSKAKDKSPPPRRDQKQPKRNTNPSTGADASAPSRENKRQLSSSNRAAEPPLKMMKSSDRPRVRTDDEKSGNGIED